MNISSEWLSAAARLSADTEGPVTVQASRPTGSVHRNEISVSFIDDHSIILTWMGVFTAGDLVPGKVWHPLITGLDSLDVDRQAPAR